MLYRNGQAFVGPSAFAHKGGMHVHAVNRAASSYEHIPPERVGNERRILVSELSGRSNIVTKTTKHDLQHDRAADGQDPGGGRQDGEPGLPIRGRRSVVRPAGQDAVRARFARTSTASNTMSKWAGMPRANW